MFGRRQVRSRLLLRRFELSHNRSLDGVLDQLSNRDMTDAGPLETLDLDDEEDERSAERAALKLPGAQRKGRHQRAHAAWGEDGRRLADGGAHRADVGLGVALFLFPL